MGAFAYLSLRHGTPGENAVFDSLPEGFEDLDQLAKQAGVNSMTSFVYSSSRTEQRENSGRPDLNR
jgi:hypothetical protein